MVHAWTRSYACGHRARITKQFTTTYSLEVFRENGDPLLRFTVLLPSLELAQQTSDAVVSFQSEPWIPARRGTFEADIAELDGISQLSG